jgi:hypothetical protein
MLVTGELMLFLVAVLLERRRVSITAPVRAPRSWNLYYSDDNE